MSMAMSPAMRCIYDQPKNDLEIIKMLLVYLGEAPTEAVNPEGPFSAGPGPSGVVRVSSLTESNVSPGRTGQYLPTALVPLERGNF